MIAVVGSDMFAQSLILPGSTNRGWEIYPWQTRQGVGLSALVLGSIKTLSIVSTNNELTTRYLCRACHFSSFEVTGTTERGSLRRRQVARHRPQLTIYHKRHVCDLTPRPLHSVTRRACRSEHSPSTWVLPVHVRLELC